MNQITHDLALKAAHDAINAIDRSLALADGPNERAAIAAAAAYGVLVLAAGIALRKALPDDGDLMRTTAQILGAYQGGPPPGLLERFRHLKP